MTARRPPTDSFWRRRRFRAVVIGSLVSLAAVLLFSERSLRREVVSPLPLLATQPFHPALIGNFGAVNIEPSTTPFEFEIEPGQTLSELFDGYGLSAQEARGAVAVLGEYLDVRRIQSRSPYRVFLDPGETVSAFEFVVPKRGTIRLAKATDEWQGEWQPFVRSSRMRVARGEIQGSLAGAVVGADAPEALAYQMAQILQWDVDFNRDLRRGDRFEVLFSELYLDSQYAGIGTIYAVHLENRGALFEAYRALDGAEGYFDGEGRPMAKRFLRSPMPFSRVTSRFSHRRFHPVLKRYRPHYGVDYGGPIGTPVRVTASGTVIHAARDRGSGNMVKVRHGNDYMTAYLHLSKFGPDIRKGSRVRQGQIIGYLGKTGLVTGPHLDYRVQHRGKWIDPLSLSDVKAEPMSRDDLPRFLAWRDQLRSGLETGEPPEFLLDLPDLKRADGVPAPTATQSDVSPQRTR